MLPMYTGTLGDGVSLVHDVDSLTCVCNMCACDGAYDANARVMHCPCDLHDGTRVQTYQPSPVAPCGVSLATLRWFVPPVTHRTNYMYACVAQCRTQHAAHTVSQSHHALHTQRTMRMNPGVGTASAAFRQIKQPNLDATELHTHRAYARSSVR